MSWQSESTETKILSEIFVSPVTKPTPNGVTVYFFFGMPTHREGFCYSDKKRLKTNHNLVYLTKP